MILTVVIFLILLGALVFVHELGHFLAAKMSGVRVDEFALGFPPRILSKKFGETLYSLGCLPFGGFVKIFGEEGENGDNSFVKKNRLIQAFILFAGIIGNVVFAWILFFIVRIHENASFFPAIYEGGKLTMETTRDIILSFWQLITDAFRGVNDFGELSGPVGIVRLVGQAKDMGLGYIFSLTAFISLNLAVINLVPFPALDGGRILFVIIEAIKRKSIEAKTANLVNTIGFSILMLLLVAVTIKDVTNLF